MQNYHWPYLLRQMHSLFIILCWLVLILYNSYAFFDNDLFFGGWLKTHLQTSKLIISKFSSFVMVSSDDQPNWTGYRQRWYLPLVKTSGQSSGGPVNTSLIWYQKRHHTISTGIGSLCKLMVLQAIYQVVLVNWWVPPNCPGRRTKYQTFTYPTHTELKK